MTRDHTKLRPYNLATARVGDKVLTSCRSEHATVVAVSSKHVAFLWENEIINTFKRKGEDNHDLHVAPLAWHKDGTPIYAGDSLWLNDEEYKAVGHDPNRENHLIIKPEPSFKLSGFLELIDDEVRYSDWKPTKPVRTIRIGEFDVPEPAREPLEKGQRYYIPTVLDSHALEGQIWRDDTADRCWLKKGLIHLTQEAAELHAKALLSFTQT